MDDTACLIVGAGPTGMTLAHLLDQLGVPCIVVERRPDTTTHPSAHVVNARTLEIWRQAGFDMAAIDALAKPPADAGFVNFLTRLDGELIGRLPFERQGSDVLELTPTPLRNISQHRLEPVLADQLRTDGADVRRGWQWESAEHDDTGVTSVIRDLDTDTTHVVRSRWLVAADGAGSRVRRSLDIDMIGPPSLQHFVAIHLGIALRPLLGDHQGVLHFTFDPDATGTFIAHDCDHEAVFMCSYDPSAESVDDYDVDRCTALVRRAIGPSADGVPIEVRSVGTWNMSAQVAASMRSGNTFLVGDAAHRFPPTGGLGLNTGVADAHALAWRLAAVDRGWADEAVLQSYETERRPVAQVNCEQSATNALKIITLVDALGLLEAPTSEQLEATLADPARRPAIDAAVAEQATHFDMLGLQLGYVYEVGALVRADGRPACESHPSVFEPTGEVGARLPHAWLADGRSTLDLVALDRMTLITTGDHDRWIAATEGVTTPLAHIRLDHELASPAGWVDSCRLMPGEALLVRPDQHIAWRGAEPADLAPTLTQILETTP